MWKVTFGDQPGGATSIYWVDGSSAAEAETTARRQAGTRIDVNNRAVVGHTDALDAADEMWPRPQLLDGVRVFRFEDSREAYDQTQVRDDIHDGDVLHIPSEEVARVPHAGVAGRGITEHRCSSRAGRPERPRHRRRGLPRERRRRTVPAVHH
jgi:hypothetical protein